MFSRLDSTPLVRWVVLQQRGTAISYDLASCPQNAIKHYLSRFVHLMELCFLFLASSRQDFPKK